MCDGVNFLVWSAAGLVNLGAHAAFQESMPKESLDGPPERPSGDDELAREPHS